MSRLIPAVAFTLLACSPVAQAQIKPQPKIGNQLTSVLTSKSQPVDIMIYMAAQADLSPARTLQSKASRGRFVVDQLRTTATRSQADLLKALHAKGIATQSYFITNLIVAENVPPSLVAEIASRSDVARVVGNPAFKVLKPLAKTQLIAEKGSIGPGANITRTGAPEVWATGVTGQGIVVAGQDTGIDWDHPGIVDQYRGSTANGVEHNYNWWDAIRTGQGGNSCGYASSEPCDDHGHGTHTLGTVVGDDGNGNQIGMAPGAKWIGCRNMDDGLGKPSTYIECFQFFLAPWPTNGNPMSDGDPAFAADVINNSWGCPVSEGCEGDEFLPVMNALSSAGVMVVAAAGNAGSSCSTIADGPAHHSAESFAVGASDHRNDAIASFSSRGPSAFDAGVGPDLTAPGVSVRSSIPGGAYSGSFWSGTSMASPHVAGAVALLWSAVPDLRGDIENTSRLLRLSAEPKTTSQNCGGVSGRTIPNNTFGHGILNIKATIDLAHSEAEAETH